MDELLTAMDRTAANLVKLQDVWNRAARFVPTGPSRGSHPEYDNLRRAWNDLLAGLPPIDGWTITDELPDIDALGQDFIDYFEISEAPFPLHEAGQKPGKDLAEYQFRLNRARSRAARERLEQFTVPQAARRYRTPSFVDADLLTPAERDAQQAFAEMENRHAEERQRLQADLDRARQDANPIRDGLFYGTGDDLVRAVETVLRSAGFDVVDLDAELGRTASADLLATLGDHRWLVEVKSEGRNASESLVNDLLRHLRIWPELRPELPVRNGALVVNHQHRLPPNERTRAVYRRQEFINALTVPVIAVHDLFDWWRTSDWPAIQHAVLDAEPPATAHAQPSSAAPAVEEPPPEESTRRPRGWRFGRRR
jgi:hypothetical protein